MPTYLDLLRVTTQTVVDGLTGDGGRVKDDAGDGGRRALSAQGVTVAYRNGTVALRDASFSIPTHTITALVGVRTGRGSPTLFKAIMGFVPARSGEIRLLGRIRQARRLRANLVAYVPQAEEVDWDLPGAGRGRGDDGPLRPDGVPAPTAARPTARR